MTEFLSIEVQLKFRQQRYVKNVQMCRYANVQMVEEIKIYKYANDRKAPN